jgi:nucleoside-diphosphate-sugar epimerase
MKEDGRWVRGVDLKRPEYSETAADEFVVGDLRDPRLAADIVTPDLDEIYQLAADMGGAGYIFTGDHDAGIMHNSAMINLNVAEACRQRGVRRIFYSSSACIYPERIQSETDSPGLKEDDAYPAGPDSEYGWEKLFSERLYLAYARNHGIDVRIARFHNVFGPEGAWNDGREKAPAAICRKVAEAADGGEIEIWGDGEQTRTFLYIDECLEGVRRLMASDFAGPVNIGSDELISINGLAWMAAEIAGKRLTLRHVPGPLGVRGRSSDNGLIQEKLGWRPTQPLRVGMEKTYRWIEGQTGSTTKNA